MGRRVGGHLAQPRHVSRRWAGLRTFAPDRLPLVGWDGRAPGFFWMAGLGGFGLQTAPALGALAAAAFFGETPAGPPDLAGVLQALSPARRMGCFARGVGVAFRPQGPGSCGSVDGT